MPGRQSDDSGQFSDVNWMHTGRPELVAEAECRDGGAMHVRDRMCGCILFNQTYPSTFSCHTLWQCSIFPTFSFTPSHFSQRCQQRPVVLSFPVVPLPVSSVAEWC